MESVALAGLPRAAPPGPHCSAQILTNDVEVAYACGQVASLSGSTHLEPVQINRAPRHKLLKIPGTAHDPPNCQGSRFSNALPLSTSSGTEAW
jgi:hypothetical protein